MSQAAVDRQNKFFDQFERMYDVMSVKDANNIILPLIPDYDGPRSFLRLSAKRQKELVVTVTSIADSFLKEKG